MTRAAIWLLAAGVCLFIGVLVSQGVTAVLATLALAGWGLIAVALFHLLPLVLDAAAIRVLLASGAGRAPMVDALLARWVGESVSSLMPAGQIGGPLLMIRQLSQRGTPAPDAAAAITVSTTFQTFAQIVFGLMGVALLGCGWSVGWWVPESAGATHWCWKAWVRPFAGRRSRYRGRLACRRPAICYWRLWRACVPTWRWRCRWRSARANCYWRHRVWSVCTYPNRRCGAVRAVLLLLNDSPCQAGTRRRD